MKILYLASLDSIHTRRWISYFANNLDNNISCASLTKSNISNHKNIKYYYLNGYKNIFTIFKLIIRLKSKEKEIIHVHYLGWNSILSLFANKNKVLILTPWGCDIYENINNIIIKYWLTYILKKSNYLICDSYKLINAACEIGHEKRNCKFILFGTNVDYFKSQKNAFYVSDDKGLIYVGTNRNMEPIYDPITFLKAAKLLCKRTSKFRFIIANDGSLKSNIEKFIKDNNLQKYIKLIGKQNGEQNLKFFNSLDIYVSTSLRDGGLAASLAEAMSCERLTIAANNSDNPIYIKHGITGYLFENKDFKELSDLIFDSSLKVNKSREIAKKGRKVIVEKYNYFEEMNKVNNIYKKFLKKN